MLLEKAYTPLLAYHEVIWEDYKNAKEFGYMPEEARLKRFGTVRLSAGRGCGNSSFIAKNAISDDIIFCTGGKTLQEIQELCRNHGQYSCSNIYLNFTARLDEGYDDYIYKNVWVDNASTVLGKIMDHLYSLMVGKCNRFILVG